MFVKRADEMRRAGKEMIVGNGQARSIRMLTKADGLGFGFSDVHSPRAPRPSSGTSITGRQTASFPAPAR